MVPSLAPMIVRSSKWSCGFLPLVCVNGVYKIAAANIQWLSVDSSSYSLPAVQHLADVEFCMWIGFLPTSLWLGLVARKPSK